MLDTTTYLPKLKEFEGVIRFMYLDNALPPGPFVTVGVGFLLANGAAAEKLAFVERANPAMKATADAIKADFENVKKQPGGKDASFYRQGEHEEPGVAVAAGEGIVRLHQQVFVAVTIEIAAVRIRATNIAPVARVLASSAIATLPADNRSPMMPDPTTAASNKAVPAASDATLRAKIMPRVSRRG